MDTDSDPNKTSSLPPPPLLPTSTSTSSTHIPTPAEHFSSIATNYERMTSGATQVIAKHLIDSTEPALTSSSYVLDNACGTGIVTREIMRRFTSVDNSSTTHSRFPRVAAVDVSSSMTGILTDTIKDQEWRGRVEVRVESAEELSYADETFTHSYTNFGLLFFEDADRAAGRIYRTLKSSSPTSSSSDQMGEGGVAYVTTWRDFGYYEAWEAACIEIVGSNRVAVTRPGVSDRWKDAGVLEETMRRAGFRDVTVYEQESWRREKSVEEMGESIAIVVAWATGSWTEEQRRVLPEVVMRYLCADRERCVVDEVTGSVTVKMVANVAVCRK